MKGQSNPKPNPVSKIKLKWYCSWQCLSTEGTKLPPLLCIVMSIYRSIFQYGLHFITQKTVQSMDTPMMTHHFSAPVSGICSASLIS